MLDQYRQDLNSDNDHLGEGRFQMSRRKVVFTLATAALALLFFLFIIGAFRSEDEVASQKETTGAVASELVDLQARVEKLEQRLQGTTVLAASAQSQDARVQDARFDSNAQTTSNDNALKLLIANSDDQIINEPEPGDSINYSQPDATATAAPAVTPAPVKSAPKTYVIQKGDTLSKISQKFYGTTKKWKAIYDANRDRINNINNLKVGAQIVIPEDSAK